MAKRIYLLFLALFLYLDSVYGLVLPSLDFSRPALLNGIRVPKNAILYNLNQLEWHTAPILSFHPSQTDPAPLPFSSHNNNFKIHTSEELPTHSHSKTNKKVNVALPIEDNWEFFGEACKEHFQNTTDYRVTGGVQFNW